VTDHIYVKHYWFNILVASMVLSVVAVFGLSLYVYGEKKHVEGYYLGTEAERIRNPSKEYIESGTSFCWDSGNFYQVRHARGGFRVVK
jgi:hypothetical protein